MAKKDGKNKMKLVWVEVEPKDIEPRLMWTKEKGWVEKKKPSQPIYVLRQENNNGHRTGD
jgi:hypothetical protein